MLCHGDIFLLSHSNKNIITCQKINKTSFLRDTKKFFVFSFNIAHWQHVDLRSCGPGNKVTSIPSFT